MVVDPIKLSNLYNLYIRPNNPLIGGIGFNSTNVRRMHS